MFFRLKETQSGQVLKLLESYRDDTGKPRHRTVTSLGNAALPKSSWKRVAKVIAAHLYGQEYLLAPVSSAAENQWIDRIVKQIASEGKWNPCACMPKNETVIDGVLADKVSHTDTAQLGPVLVGWQIWRRLGLPELLRTLGFSRSQEQAAAISVINRLVEPVSEHGVLDWYRRTGLPELMGNKLRGAGDDRFYRTGDLLLDNLPAIERHLRERQRSLFNLNRTVLLYDLTNSHFEGACHENPKARRGANKQKRNDCPQIVVGMVFDQYGFEMAHKIFAGTQNDGKSLLAMIAALNNSAGADGTKPLIIMDGGVATRKNLDLLRGHGFGYLVNDSRRKRQAYREQFLEEDAFSVVSGRAGKPEVLVRVLNDPHAREATAVAERVVLCKSEPRCQKEKAIISNTEVRFLNALQKLARRIEQGGIKDRAKIQRAIGRIQNKHTRVRRYYQITLESNAQHLRLKWQRDDERLVSAEELCGCYVLRTDERTLNEHQLWQLYMSLTQAENGFKALKTNLGLRPNPHHKEDRVDAHVFICVLAYHLLRHILWILEQKGDHRSWETLKQILQTHCYTTILMPTNRGSTYRIRKAGQPEACQKAIYRALGIEWQSLPTNRTKIRGVPNLANNSSQPTTL